MTTNQTKLSNRLNINSNYFNKIKKTMLKSLLIISGTTFLTAFWPKTEEINAAISIEHATDKEFLDLKEDIYFSEERKVDEVLLFDDIDNYLTNNLKAFEKIDLINNPPVYELENILTSSLLNDYDLKTNVALEIQNFLEKKVPEDSKDNFVFKHVFKSSYVKTSYQKLLENLNETSDLVKIAEKIDVSNSDNFSEKDSPERLLYSEVNDIFYNINSSNNFAVGDIEQTRELIKTAEAVIYLNGIQEKQPLEVITANIDNYSKEQLMELDEALKIINYYTTKYGEYSLISLDTSLGRLSDINTNLKEVLNRYIANKYFQTKSGDIKENYTQYLPEIENISNLFKPTEEENHITMEQLKNKYEKELNTFLTPANLNVIKNINILTLPRNFEKNLDIFNEKVNILTEYDMYPLEDLIKLYQQRYFKNNEGLNNIELCYALEILQLNEELLKKEYSKENNNLSYEKLYEITKSLEIYNEFSKNKFIDSTDRLGYFEKIVGNAQHGYDFLERELNSMLTEKYKKTLEKTNNSMNR